MFFECFSFHNHSRNVLICFSNPFKEHEKKKGKEKEKGVFHFSAVKID